MTRRRFVIGRAAMVAASALVVSATGCGPDDQRTEDLDPAAASAVREEWSSDLVSALDSGNAAVRTDSFAVARRHFRRVIELDSTVVAGWFGLYLAEQGLGRPDEAARAAERAEALTEGRSLLTPAGDRR